MPLNKEQIGEAISMISNSPDLRKIMADGIRKLDAISNPAPAAPQLKPGDWIKMPGKVLGEDVAELETNADARQRLRSQLDRLDAAPPATANSKQPGGWIKMPGAAAKTGKVETEFSSK